MKAAALAVIAILATAAWFISENPNPPQEKPQPNQSTKLQRPTKNPVLETPQPRRQRRPSDPATRIITALHANDLTAVQVSAYAWFEQDPVAARNWLATQPTLEDLQPAIAFITAAISSKGDMATALQWSDLISEKPLHEQILFGIYVDALHRHEITPDEIPENILAPEFMAELNSGAAGD